MTFFTSRCKRANIVVFLEYPESRALWCKEHEIGAIKKATTIANKRQ
ncbi:unnamed protein product [Amoebophrya sp. A25]|nr:unnamed protein product [Amoebophrya sp. A25]|eukprot:GSA25T00017997001.1